MQSQAKSGTLYLVATPIGNLSDISARAVSTLQDVDFIAAEDTRVTRKLLTHIGVSKPLISYRAHNANSAGDGIVSKIIEGQNCALVTDAGTPGVSDPGEALVRLCALHNIPMVIIPGPCAAVAALVLSGMPTARFVFEGFLPLKPGKRIKRLTSLAQDTRTIIFYESPHRLVRTLSDMLKVFGDRRISVSREMTKIYEETLRLKISEALEHFTAVSPRGEFVIVVEGAEE